MKIDKPIKIELLAPAKDLDVAIAAIDCGADAIYMGANKFGARANATNSLDDIKAVVEYAHQFNVKVYITINTIIKDNEIALAEQLITELYAIGVDALIIQDMGILMMNIPPIPLHASTQCDIRTAERAKFLSQVGFSQLVLARELSLSEISEIHTKVNVPIEVFIHGALCVSYSGRCHLSEAINSRSANRGECAQLCRLPYDLIDGDGHIIKKSKHLLSLKDLNQSQNIKELLEAGATSFKIEGRLKDKLYVKNVVSKYRQILDTIIKEQPDRYMRSSLGHINYDFIPNLEKSFNRQFTNYFLHGRSDNMRIASHDTPKSFGEKIGSVASAKGKDIIINTKAEIANGDGFSYLDSNGIYSGFRINRAVGNKVTTLNPISISKNTLLYRTFDKIFEDNVLNSKASRKINIKFTLIKRDNHIYLRADDERGISNEILILNEFQRAKANQRESQIRILSKLGDTIYNYIEVISQDDIFIPASILTNGRRTIIQLMNNSQLSSYSRPVAGVRNNEAIFDAKNLDFSFNVANHLAEEFYKKHGVDTIEPALEVSSAKGSETLMTTRYCLRRELGACKKLGGNEILKEPLKLRSDGFTLSIEFDCANCEMKIRKS